MTIPASCNLAVLVDADNAQASVMAGILGEVARYGTATVKRAYGDWTTPNLTNWKKVLNVHAIQPIQQFGYTRGKNATDSALIIDAMDLLHGGRVDGFCLVSSDSDFTRLATRIREAGLVVYGFGEKKTPQPFVAACDKFVFQKFSGSEWRRESLRKLRPQSFALYCFRPCPLPVRKMVGHPLQRSEAWSTRVTLLLTRAISGTGGSEILCGIKAIWKLMRDRAAKTIRQFICMFVSKM